MAFALHLTAFAMEGNVKQDSEYYLTKNISLIWSLWYLIFWGTRQLDMQSEKDNILEIDEYIVSHMSTLFNTKSLSVITTGIVSTTNLNPYSC